MSGRMDKINALVRAELGRTLGSIQPAGAMATVTMVKTSSDLAEAKAWISLLPDSDPAWQELAGRLPELQAGLAERLVIKRTPRLTLRRDRSGEHAHRITQLLDGDG